MGAVRSALRKPFRNFNIESRAHKELDKQKIKPVSAPRYDPPPVSSQGQDLEYDPITKSRDQLLHERLKVVRVESFGPANKSFERRKLPERSTSLPEPEYGVVEPNTIPLGRITISQALDLISQHQSKPELYPASRIAQEYKLELYNAQQILKYFQVFHMHIPKKMEERFPHLLTILKTQVSQLESEKQKKLLDFANKSGKSDENETVKKDVLEKSS